MIIAGSLLVVIEAKKALVEKPKTASLTFAKMITTSSLVDLPDGSAVGHQEMSSFQIACLEPAAANFRKFPDFTGVSFASRAVLFPSKKFIRSTPLIDMQAFE